jgi:hypothetical protein
MNAGDPVRLQLPIDSPLNGNSGQVVGFYINEPPRVVVALASGEQVVVMESDTSPG